MFDRLAPDALDLSRTTYLAETEAGSFDASSGFGGYPYLPEGSEHPVCPRCARPIPLLAQLAIGELPHDARPIGEGLLQLFYCHLELPGGGQTCDLELAGWAPFSAAHAVRIVADATGRVSSDGAGLTARRVTGWTPVLEVPGGEELAERGVTVPDQVWDDLGEAEIPRPGEKIGGWPMWIQGVEYPECPKCHQRMSFVLQIDSERNVPIMLGDSGIGHVTQCRTHPDVLAFAWACS